MSNEKRKTRDERKLVAIMVVVLSAVNLFLLYIGAYPTALIVLCLL